MRCPFGDNCAPSFDGQTLMANPRVPPRMNKALAGLLAILVSGIAGCADANKDPSAGPAQTDESVFEGLDLQATSTTGVIRGIVVDEAIRPLAGVSVTIQGRDDATTSNHGGAFGFDGLDPGAYTVAASLAGHVTVQIEATVVAGLDDPDLVKILLGRDASGGAFFTERTFEGFLECDAATGNWCYLANKHTCTVYSAAGQRCTNVTADNSFFAIDVTDLNGPPDWTQSELVWKSTQSVFTYLLTRIDILVTPPTIEYSNSSHGNSPLKVTFNRTEAEDHKLGTEGQLGLKVFSYGNPTLCDTNANLCAATAAVNQRITFYVHLFYGYEPPHDWRFTDNSEVPGPPPSGR